MKIITVQTIFRDNRRIRPGTEMEWAGKKCPVWAVEASASAKAEPPAKGKAFSQVGKTKSVPHDNPDPKALSQAHNSLFE